MNDAELTAALERLRADNRDPAAWEALYRHFYPWLFSLCFRSLRGSRVLAEEAVQEIMLRFWKGCDFSVASTPAGAIAYLSSAARSVLVDLFRRGQSSPQEERADPQQSDEEFFGQSQETGPESQVLFRIRLEEAIAQLAPREAQIAAWLLQERDASAIAESLEIAEKTAYNLISGVRRKLRQLLFD